MRVLFTLFLLVFPTLARAADQIDYVLKFATEAAAQQAAQIGGFWNASEQTWSGAQVIAPIQVWQTTAITIDPVNGPIETRLFQSGYWMLVSTEGRNSVIEGCACLMLETDRTLAGAGKPVGTWMLVNNTGISAAALGRSTLPTWHIEPMFAGSQSVYHLGGGQ